MASATYLAPGVYVEEVPSARQPIAGVGTNVAGFIGIVSDTIYIPVPNPDYDPVAARAKAAISDLTASVGTQPMSLADKAAAVARAADALATLEAQVTKLDGEKTSIQTKLKGLEEPEKQAETDLETANSDVTAKETALEAAPADNNATQRADLKKARAAALAAQNRKATIAQQKTDLQLEMQHKDDELTDATAQRDAAKKALDDAGKAVTPAPAPAPGGGDGGAAPEGGEGGGGGAPAGEGGQDAKSKVEQEDLEFTDDPDDSLLKRSIFRPYVIEKFKVRANKFDTKLCTNFTEYTQRFGSFSAFKAHADNESDDPEKWIFSPMFPGHHALTHAVNGFFQNGGTKAFVARISDPSELNTVLEQFKSIDELALIAIPGLPKMDTCWDAVQTHVEMRENCFAILDCPLVVNDPTSNSADLAIQRLTYSGDPDNAALPRPCKNSAYYFPQIEVVDPAKELQDIDYERKVSPKYRGRTYVAPSGHMAGIYARTDAERGVHKAPANTVVRGAVEVKYYVSKPIQEMLNPQGVNAIRIMNGAVTVWGARVTGGDLFPEWKYINVRRLFLFLQKSIEEGTQWIVFEPNDEALWAKIRLNVSAFLTNVWRSGALFGSTPEEAFYVKCDAELNPPEVRDVGQVVTEIGVSIVRPAEFVIFRITQATGATRT
jgi:phage tail sheath protein FI